MTGLVVLDNGVRRIVTGVAVDDLTYRLDVADGNITGITSVNKFGRNSDAMKDGTVPIWSGGKQYPYQATANIPSMVSDNANDNATGTGAQCVEIQGLVDNSGVWTIETEERVTNGLTPVAFTKNFIRIFRARTVIAGNNGSNEGEIRIFNGADDYAFIEPILGRSTMCLFTVPSGKTGYIKNYRASLTHEKNSNGEKSGEVGIITREFGNAFNLIESEAMDSRGSGAINVNFEYPDPIPEKADIQLAFQSHDNHSLITGSFLLILKDNP